MKKLLSLLIFLMIVSSLSSKLLAWGTTGHRIIAEIAEKNLNRKATKNINKLLDKQHMAYWANWPDEIKSDTTGRWDHTHIWHFVNAPAYISKSQYIDTIKNIQHDNIYSALNKLIEILKDKKNTKTERKEALIFIIHLMGDMHQPMHAGRAEDRGGNSIKVQWFGQNTNLHSLWDSKLIDSEKYSYTEYATVLNVLSNKEKRNKQAGCIESWLYESHTIANYIYSSTQPEQSLSYNYDYKMRSIINDQLQKAGLRLAKLLNEMF